MSMYHKVEEWTSIGVYCGAGGRQGDGHIEVVWAGDPPKPPIKPGDVVEFTTSPPRTIRVTHVGDLKDNAINAFRRAISETQKGDYIEDRLDRIEALLRIVGDFFDQSGGTILVGSITYGEDNDGE